MTSQDPAPAAPTAQGLPAAQSPALAAEITHLRDMEATLSDRLSVLTAQQAVLQNAMRGADPALRVQFTSQLTDLNLRMTEVQVELARVQSQLAARGISVPTPTPGELQPPPPPPQVHFLDNDQVTAITIVFILAVLMPISIGFLRRMWRGASKAAPVVTDAVSPRLDRLEHATDAIALEIERISEGQRFVTKVLAERPVSAPQPPSAQQGSASVLGDANAMGEGKPFLALGAGPIEPIRMPERQGMRQSITPH